jgi:hypothetical protein
MGVDRRGDPGRIDGRRCDVRSARWVARKLVLASIRATAQHRLAITPFSFRKAAQNPARRELIIPFGGTGYVALHEIVSDSEVLALAVRHQREEDYH